MNKPDYELEVSYKVWDNIIGTCVEVGPDSDGIGLLELKRRDEKNEITDRFTMTWEEAVLVAKAILDLNERRKKMGSHD